MTKLSLGFSPCPNDTFIFDALVNKKIDTPGFDFEPVLEDVETLNKWALQGKLDMTKISFGVLPLLSGKYELLDSGAALGKGVGPLLIAREPIDPTRIREKNVAIPGENTTANLLFSLAFPDSTKKKFMVFSAIEDAVLSGETDCGVIIHENRFTYEKRGLRAIMDLGDYWERKTACPVPLGGIVMRRRFSAESRLQVSAQIKKSIEKAFASYPEITEYVRRHAQAMDESVMRKHIDLYVNDYSLSLGETGRRAITRLVDIHKLSIASSQ